MSDGNVGALVVTDGDKPVGIVSERDYARKGILRRRFALDTLVADIMSTPLVSISPQDSVTTCMERMVGHEIRHLPVMDGERLVGMLSISDLLEAVPRRNLTTQRHKPAARLRGGQRSFHAPCVQRQREQRQTAHWSLWRTLKARLENVFPQASRACSRSTNF